MRQAFSLVSVFAKRYHPPLATAQALMTKRKHAEAMKIGTHSGSFHCDEALGCWLLLRTNQFKDADIVRSRDPEVLKDLDVVIDVGGTYDPEGLRFDHHQRGFDEVFGSGFSTKLSSAGMVYKHFGKEVLRNVLSIAADHPQLDTLYLKLYANFMEAVDAIDNGVNQFDTEAPPRYINRTDLSSRVQALMPAWNEPSSDAVLDAQFRKAMDLAGAEFEAAACYLWQAWLPARGHVAAALENACSLHESGGILKLEQFCPWKEHIFDLEEEMGILGRTKYCLYEDTSGSWRIQCVPQAVGRFENRKSLPAPWRGVRDAELSELSGIPQCVFVHAAGFIGGNRTYDGALQMALAAIAWPEDDASVP